MSKKKSETKEGRVYLPLKHRGGERSDPLSDKTVLGMEFKSREHMAQFLRSFKPPDTNCYYDFKGLDLSHLDLSGARLAHARFDGADLTGTNLRNADISYAWLRGATGMKNADMTGVTAIKTRVDERVYSTDVICASDTFNNAVNKPTKSELKARQRELKRSRKQRGAISHKGQRH